MDTLFVDYNLRGDQRLEVWDSIIEKKNRPFRLRLKGSGHLCLMGEKYVLSGLFVSDHSRLSIYTSNGIPVIGDFYLKENSHLDLDRKSIISSHSTVTLKDSFIAYYNGSTFQNFHQLIIEGFSAFEQPDGNKRVLYLDDLLVTENSLFALYNWREGTDSLFVRKDSEHLQDALGRIKFQGRREPYAGVKDYDRDYWQIVPSWEIPELPEPSTYGALFSVFVIGSLSWKRRRGRNR